MDTLALLQHYWWFVIALLGAALVFLLFVQGGQGLLGTIGRTEEERDRLVQLLGRKWELTFTTLVTFGGAFFASFPLFYATSFGGAFCVWTLLLLCFVAQAVAYEYRRKPNNLFGTKFYDRCLLVNGLAGPLLLGTAIGTLFTGAPFTVARLNLADAGGTTAVSQWATPWHGLEALADGRNVALGLAVLLLARLLALQFFLYGLDDETLRERARRRSPRTAAAFLVAFALFLAGLLRADRCVADPATGIVRPEPCGYLHNLAAMPAVAVALAAGIGLVLRSILLGCRGSRRAFRAGGAGTVLTVLSLLLLAGWNETSYYPSTVDPQSSLTIRNSSSSLFTLRVMSVVSLFIPFVAAYIAYAWRVLGRSDTPQEQARPYGAEPCGVSRKKRAADADRRKKHYICRGDDPENTR